MEAKESNFSALPESSGIVSVSLSALANTWLWPNWSMHAMAIKTPTTIPHHRRPLSIEQGDTRYYYC